MGLLAWETEAQALTMLKKIADKEAYARVRHLRSQGYSWEVWRCIGLDSIPLCKFISTALVQAAVTNAWQDVLPMIRRSWPAGTLAFKKIRLVEPCSNS